MRVSLMQFIKSLICYKLLGKNIALKFKKYGFYALKFTKKIFIHDYCIWST